MAKETPPQAPKNKGGRPSKFNKALGEEICRRLAEGASLRRICREDPEMPDVITILRWLSDGNTKHARFCKQYEKARQVWAEAVYDELSEIADNGSNDFMDKNDPDNPGYKVNGEVVARSRLRVDTRKWQLARMNPKKFGDKLDVTSGDEKLKTGGVTIIQVPDNGR